MAETKEFEEKAKKVFSAERKEDIWVLILAAITGWLGEPKPLRVVLYYATILTLGSIFLHCGTRYRFIHLNIIPTG